MKDMRIEHDKAADAMYIHIGTGLYARGEDLDDERRVDYDSGGAPIGVELLCVSQGVNIEGLPDADEIARVLKGQGINIFELSCSYTGFSLASDFNLPAAGERGTGRQSAHINVAVLA